jgi:CDP-diacylglycerol--glycerol-3-phosphate 3-phosphatidyltransferase
VSGIPNFLSSVRLGFVPVLLMLAYAGHAKTFLICLIISLLTDTFDGIIARRLNATTVIGAKLDSIADLATCLAMPPCGWWLRPEVLMAEVAWIVAALCCYVAAQAAGLVKFHQLPSYHTWTGKTIATVAAIEFVVIFAGGPGWTLRILALLVALASLESILITITLRKWRTNIPSLWHALKRR